MPSEPARVVLLTDDLIDGSRVAGSVRAHGGLLTSLRDANQLATAIRDLQPVCVIVDLQHPRLQPAEVADQVRKSATQSWLIGFGAHVDVASLRAARQAGFDQVMPRSQFFEEIETRVRDWLRLRETR